MANRSLHWPAMASASFVSAGAPAARRPTLETLVRPYTLLLLGGALSFLAWAIPWGRTSHCRARIRASRAVDLARDALRARVVRVLLHRRSRRVRARTASPTGPARRARPLGELLRLPHDPRRGRDGVLVRLRGRQVAARLRPGDPAPAVQPGAACSAGVGGDSDVALRRVPGSRDRHLRAGTPPLPAASRAQRRAAAARRGNRRPYAPDHRDDRRRGAGGTSPPDDPRRSPQARRDRASSARSRSSAR